VNRAHQRRELLGSEHDLVGMLAEVIEEFALAGHQASEHGSSRCFKSGKLKA
jgi:hypothetical protein